MVRTPVDGSSSLVDWGESLILWEEEAGKRYREDERGEERSNDQPQEEEEGRTDNKLKIEGYVCVLRWEKRN